MKFKTIDQYHQQSECKRYTIYHNKDNTVRDGVIFTLASSGKMIAQERCANIGSERAQAVRDLQEAAKAHAGEA